MSAESDAVLAAALFAVDPHGLGGICIRSQVHPARDQWLQLLRDLLPPESAMRRIPCNIADDRLLGGLDLVATLKSNRPIAERGALALCDGGVVVVAMAERLSAHTASCLNTVLDEAEVRMSRDGVSGTNAARIGLVALDEGISPDECVPSSLRDRCAFLLDFNEFSMRTLLLPTHERSQIREAREALCRIEMQIDIINALCSAALELGAGSPRISLLALRVARAAAALAGRQQLTHDDAVIAARLVLAPRASIAPPVAESQAEPEPQAEPQAEPQNQAQSSSQDQASSDMSVDINPEELQDLVLAAATAAIPKGLLAQLKSAAENRASRSNDAGRAGALRNAGTRGRPAGVRVGKPGATRLSVMDTLRAAAPWQRLRGRGAHGDARVRITADDFRVARYKQHSRTLTIFAVDASGSSALNRLAEAKGAVELLLADCYIRRDHVAVIGFRGREAELLLPPTRSLVRAKRSLAGLAGGGATPLAAAIDASAMMATQAQRRGETPTIVMLTDGRANVARNGDTGREVGQADALKSAAAMRANRITALLVDTSPRPNPLARALAQKMDAQYIALPYANAQALSQIVTAAASRGSAK